MSDGWIIFLRFQRQKGTRFQRQKGTWEERISPRLGLRLSFIVISSRRATVDWFHLQPSLATRSKTSRTASWMIT